MYAALVAYIHKNQSHDDRYHGMTSLNHFNYYKYYLCKKQIITHV